MCKFILNTKQSSFTFQEQPAVTGEKVQRRGSVGSLDSGMSVSFQSTSASTCSRSDKLPNKGGKQVHYQPSFLGGLFNKKQTGVPAKTTEV